MIASLNGKVSELADDHIILDVNGVGYEVFVPVCKLLNYAPEMNTYLHIYSHIKEDSFALYGFATVYEKQLFKVFLSINGVGPKLALTILNTPDIKHLLNALQLGDIKYLTKIPGIGSKTAERMILELKNKKQLRNLSLVIEPASAAAVAKTPQTKKAPVKKETSSKSKQTLPAAATKDPFEFNDAINALVNLGYKDHDAAAAVRKVMLGSDEGLPQIIKLALQELASQC